MAELAQFFNRQRWQRAATLMVLALLLVLPQWLLHVDFADALFGIGAGWQWLGKNFMPNQAALGDLGEILHQLGRTIVIAVAATSIAGVVALLLALAGAKTTSRLPLVQMGVRLFASCMRNIPFVAWALVLLFSFKQNDFTGFLALFLMTIGYLTRAFVETLEEVPRGVIEALEVTGARYWQIIGQGVLPAVSAPLMSWLLYMIENNIRDATLVGMLTGTGIGFIFDLYFKSFRYPSAGLVVLAIIAVTIAIELTSTKLRQVLAQ
ncbi:ABC transporter permease subunit [Lacticaseibacillus mingshuiensis]|uniref:ABC transporter permease subunit n=1 Tax=Lacticaseibacillus mingshuiensis TaxID=2799574 RepID=A0ABW4CJ30_9LACO|nr:ABC transporter permease subunit [Lacticaseibacillus mingshuiensis]